MYIYIYIYIYIHINYTHTITHVDISTYNLQIIHNISNACMHQVCVRMYLNLCV